MKKILVLCLPGTKETFEKAAKQLEEFGLEFCFLPKHTEPSVMDTLKETDSFFIVIGSDLEMNLFEKTMLNTAISISMRDSSFSIVPLLLPEAKAEDVYKISMFLASRVYGFYNPEDDHPEALVDILSGALGVSPRDARDKLNLE